MADVVTVTVKLDARRELMALRTMVNQLRRDARRLREGDERFVTEIVRKVLADEREDAG